MPEGPRTGDPPVPKVGVVTPIHNGIEHTVRMLESLRSSTYPNFETFIVDLGSVDGSREQIQSTFPEVNVIPARADMWWSAGTNLGVRGAIDRGCRYVFTLNNDSKLDPDALSALVRAAEAEAGALVGAKVNRLDDPSKVWFFGQRFDSDTGDVLLVGGEDEGFDEARSVEMLTGMGMLIPVEVFDRVGFFDEVDFPQYFADSDMSLRARAAGYRLLVTPESKIYNDVSSSWPARGIASGRLTFGLQLLLSKRSPYSIRTRHRFYKRYWGSGYRRALLRLYLTVARTYVPEVLKSKLARWQRAS